MLFRSVGNTTDKPYNITFQVPIPIQQKYIKVGGNNYILINQLFPKSIQKISPNLVRFYTHYSTCSLSIKNTKLTAENSFNDIEENFVQQLLALKAIKTELFTPQEKDDIAARYNIGDLQEFKYSKMEITI